MLDNILTYEEFSKQFNNFHLCFVDMEGNSWRNKKYLKRFQQEHPDLESQLTELFTIPLFTELNIMGSWDKESIKRFEEKYDEKLTFIEAHKKELYEAYKIMAQYIGNNSELFS